MHVQSCISRASDLGGKNSNESSGGEPGRGAGSAPKRGPVSHRSSVGCGEVTRGIWFMIHE